MGFDRFEALKQAIRDGNVNFAMMIADFHLVRGTIFQEQYDELHELAYPTPVEVPVEEGD